MTAMDTATTTTGVADLSLDELQEAIKTVGYAIRRRPPVPVLGGVRIDIVSDGVVVAGYDFDVSVRVHVPGTVTGTGTALVGHSECAEVLSALATGKRKKTRQNQSVQVGMDATGRVTLSVDGTTVPITALPLEDYPVLPDMSAAETVTTVDRSDFVEALKRVTVARGKDETLPMLTGVQLTAVDDALRLECTDRFRLTRAHVPAEGTSEGITSLPPAHRLVELCKRLSGPQLHLGTIADDRPTTRFEESAPPLLSLMCGSVQISMRTLYEKYPETDRLFPETAAYSVTASRPALRERSDAAGAVAKAKNAPAELQLVPSENGMTIAPSLPDEQDQVSVPETPATVTGTPEGPVYFNAAFLSAALDNFSSDTVTLHFQPPSRPLLVTETEEGIAHPEQYRHLLMPVRKPQS